MRNWEVCNQAIPRGMKERVAEILHCSADYIRRWCREPLSSEFARADGHYSPLDRFLDFLDAVFLVSRQGAAMIINHINAHYHRLLCPDPTILTVDNEVDRNRAGAELLQQCGHAVDSLMREGATRETVYRLITLQQKAQEILDCANQDRLRNEAANVRPLSTPRSTVSGGIQ